MRRGGRWGLVVVAVAIASLLGTLMQSIVVPIIGRIPEYLATTPAAATWVFTAILVSGAVSSVLMGRLADMYGKRRMLLLCLALLIVGSVIGALAQDIVTLIVGRALQGFAVATVPIAFGILRDGGDGRRLLRGIAVVTVMTQISGGFGAAMAGLVAEYLSWQALFWGSALLGAIAFVCVALWVPSDAGQPEARFDAVGAIGLVVGLVALLIGVSNGSLWGWASAATLGCLIGGGLVLTLWGWYEARRRSALVDVRILLDRPVLLTNIASLLFGFGMYAIIVAMPQMIVAPIETGYGLGETMLMAGLVGAPSILVAILAPYAATWLIRRIGGPCTLGAGGIVLALAYLQLGLAHASVLDFVIANAIVTLGLSLGMAAMPATILALVPRERSAEANGVNTVIRTAGMAMSTAVTAAIISSILIADGFGAGELPAHGAYLTAFAVAAIACVLVVPAVALVRVPGRGRSARGPAGRL